MLRSPKKAPVSRPSSRQEPAPKPPAAPAPKPPAMPEPAALADALFSKVQQQVLGALFGSPSRSFYTNQLIGLAGTGTRAVQRELARLEASGLVNVTHVGKEKRYQANVASLLFEELRALAFKTFGVTDVLRAALNPVASSIHGAFIYGSVARGHDASQKAIDVIVISDTLTDAGVKAALEPASVQLGRKISTTIYSPKAFAARAHRQNSMLKRLLAQPKLWLIGSDRDLLV